LGVIVWRNRGLLAAAAFAPVAVAASCTPPGPPVQPPPQQSVSIPLAAPQPPSADAKFAIFVRDFRTQAIAAGVRPETYDACMAGVRRLPHVEELNQKQPEFVKPVWQYLADTTGPARVAQGQQLIAANAATLHAIEARYGVPKEILVAVWAMESAYGNAQGGFSLFSALTTLAYDGPRAEFARRELIAAMKMVERDRLNPRTLTSSWAGAFGQTQFEPSSYLSHAVDGDGDGRIDVWHSPADALASAAVLLSRAGWHPGQWCYQEVRLPNGFPYEEADADTVQPVAHWRSLGVTPARSGTALPDDMGPASIYLPAGARGPAFMLFDNFRAVLKYNNADSYALSVCNLADRYRGGGAILASWPTNERPLVMSERIAVQQDLRALGYDPGAIDGVLGRKARGALRRYQKDHQLPADGYPTVDMLARLTADLRSRAS
jgi:membrane-bound lytic murein transglycosylase B